MASEQSTSPLSADLQDRVSIFTAEIIDLFANRCIGPKPTRPVDWRRAGCGCGCEMCLQLDSFLGNPSQEEFSISAGNEDGMRHLTGRLPGIDQPFWKGEKPENETQVEPGFKLKVRKTVRA
ncbi:uncharacterized protein PV06_11269 [Exophiala oligosperma]|uniref:Uncharacterized protein n=1 Tax=Exophiala oligosperma TaxID=215243 RepID=A0A0D2DLF6_9EURO|nr:uncharacterized protein PV06_11269 [Exophiala oligosperma]KIW36504.1 hypothetical protein PV06_11269 [Exophiala oligosperma]